MRLGLFESRALRAPEDDSGYEPEIDDEIETDQIEDDEVDRDEDEGEGDAASAEEGKSETAAPRTGEDEQVRQPSRAERRIQQALREAKEAKERADRLERLVAERAPQPPKETPEQRAERLALMDPEDRIRYEVNEQVGSLRNEFAGLKFQLQDTADRTAFDALCARNPAAAKFKDDVEKYLTDMRRSGTTAPRETVLRYVIGDRALANASRATGKAKRTAEVNRARQQAQPGRARGDAAAESRRGGSDSAEARRARLENMQL